MPHAAPYEVVMGPAEIWIAPVGTAFPLVDAEPTGPWEKVGTNGNKNYTEDGVTVSIAKSTATFSGLGSMGPVKAVISVVGWMCSVGVADITPALLSLLMNSNTVTEVAAGGEAGYHVIDGLVDPQVTNVALLVRGPSPLAATGYGQFEVVKAFESSESSDLLYVKSGAATTANLRFTAMEDIAAESGENAFYRFRAMSAVAVS
jgi:hypothetical protein